MSGGLVVSLFVMRLCVTLCVQRRNPISKSGVAALNEALQLNKILKLLHVSGFVISFLHGLCFGNQIHPYNECTSINFSLKVMN